MANSRTLTLIVLLSIFITRSQTKGDQAPEKQQSSAVNHLTEFRELTYMEGSDVTLRCVNGTDVSWNEFIYIVWNISVQDKKCYLGLSPKLDDTCNDGKKLYNTSDGVSLFIPKISMKDEGFYNCDFSYKGGSNNVNVSVIVTQISTNQVTENGQRFAVCTATYKKRKPKLHWEPALNSSVKITSMGTFYVMESRVDLDDNNVTISEITCVASYPSVSGSHQQRSTLQVESGKQPPENSSFKKTLAISVGSVCFFLVSLAIVYVLHRKINSLSALKTLCCKSKISPPAEEKPPQPVDVEEVEPYASYIQRVNSIYNSSAELFNA